MVYDADGLLQTVTTLPYNVTTGSYSTAPYDRITYYYEQYDDTQTGISNVTTEGGISIYPNPAGSYVTIKSAQPLICILYTLTGQVLLPAAQRSGINMAPYVPGMYILQTTDASGNTHSFRLQH